MIKDMRRFWVPAFVCVFGAAFFLFRSYSSGSELVMTGFSQEPAALYLVFNRAPKTVSVSVLQNVPSNLNETLADVVRNDSETIPVPIDASEEPMNEYSILIAVEGKFIELVRQPEKWLQYKFGFKRTGGYTIMGRKTLEIRESEPSPSGKLIFKSWPSIEIKEFGNSPYKEVRLATGALRWLWSQPISQGPSNRSYDEFLELPLEQKLVQLRSGAYSVMCQGFRDLFLHASVTIPGLKVRAIEAYNSRTVSKDLISYGHSTAEIWIEELGRWVLFDPWLAIALESDFELIGAEEISKRRSAPGTFKVLPLLEHLPRKIKQANGDEILSSIRPADLKLDGFTCENVGCVPGFLDYFNLIRLNHFEVVE